MEDPKLRDHFKFDEADLQANRSGNFSRDQKKKLYSRHSSAVTQKRVVSGVVIPVSIGMLVWMVYRIYKDIVNGNGSDLGPVVLLGIIGALLLLAGSYILRISFIGPTYVLKKVTGPINIIKTGIAAEDAWRYELHVGGEIFNLHLDSTAGDVMTQGEPYIIYYSQGVENNLREILSAELVSKAK